MPWWVDRWPWVWNQSLWKPEVLGAGMGSVGVSVGDGVRGHVVKAPPPRGLFSHHEMSTGSPGSSQEHSLLPDPCHTKHCLKLSSSWLARMAALTIQASQTLFWHEEWGRGQRRKSSASRVDYLSGKATRNFSFCPICQVMWSYEHS